MTESKAARCGPATMAPGPVVLPRRRLGQVTEDFLAQLWSRQQFLNASLEDIPSDFDVTFVGTKFGEIREVVPGSDGDSGEPSELDYVAKALRYLEGTRGGRYTPWFANMGEFEDGPPAWVANTPAASSVESRGGFCATAGNLALGGEAGVGVLGGFRAGAVRREVSDRFGASSRVIPLLEGIGAFPGIGVEAMRLYAGERG